MAIALAALGDLAVASALAHCEERRLRRWLRARCPWIDDVSPFVVDAFVEAEVRARTLNRRFQWMARRYGAETDQALDIADAATAAELEAHDLGEQLGLSPMARLRPGVWKAFWPRP